MIALLVQMNQAGKVFLTTAAGASLAYGLLATTFCS